MQVYDNTQTDALVRKLFELLKKKKKWWWRQLGDGGGRLAKNPEIKIPPY